MHGYGWVTRGGIYMVLDGRWCKITAFRKGSQAPAGWGAWQRLDAVSTARFDRPEFTPADPAAVIPGDFVEMLGPDHWACTTEVNTVLEVELLEPSPSRDDRSGNILVTSDDAAWIIYADNIEVLHADAAREIRDMASPPQGTRLLRIVREERSDAVTWTDMRTI